MKQFINSIYTLATANNSHEEDNDAFEYQYESASDQFLGRAATVAVVLILIMLLFR